MPSPDSNRLSTAAAAALQEGRGVRPGLLAAATWIPAADLPELPGLRPVTPMTATVTLQTMRGMEVHLTRQIVTRTDERVHVLLSGREEWLFVRSPRDPRRVCGFAIHHAVRTIVIYTEPDLRQWKGIRGWADVLLFGLRPELVLATHASATTRLVNGVVFTRHLPAEEWSDLRDLWWNAAEMLPERYSITTPAGLVHFAINRMQPAIDPRLLLDPSERFALYQVVDMGEWLER
jgi:hypothetical protein